MASGRGITIRIDRVQAMRILAAAMRDKQAEFERDKKAWPKRFARAQKAIIRACTRQLQQVRLATKPEQLTTILNNHVMSWQEYKDLVPPVPALNLCEEKQLLLMLQSDVRKVVPINSNHKLWAILQGKCEVIQ